MFLDKLSYFDNLNRKQRNLLRWIGLEKKYMDVSRSLVRAVFLYYVITINLMSRETGAPLSHLVGEGGATPSFLKHKENLDIFVLKYIPIKLY
jgi:hypothetical protein